MSIADTIIRSYERDLQNGIAASLVRRHALKRVNSLRDTDDEAADKLFVWINSSL